MNIFKSISLLSCKKVAKLAEKALWKHFIKNYLEAYDFALSAANGRK